MKTVFKLSGFFIFCSFFCCRNQNSPDAIFATSDSLKSNGIHIKECFKNVTFKPVQGERISITGDFDGDCIPDTLIEEYISQLTNKETFKDYLPVNVKSELTNDEEIMLTDTVMSLICSNKPLVRLKSASGKIKTLTLPYYCNLTGIAYLINLGNLNQVNGDELAIVTDAIRFAGVTDKCHIYSYIKNSWKEVFSFDIREDSYEKPDVKTEIPGYLEKKNDKWYFLDYSRELSGSLAESGSGKMIPLTIK